MRLCVWSAWNTFSCFIATALNAVTSPLRTAAVSDRYGCKWPRIPGMSNSARVGISPSSSRMTVSHLCTEIKKPLATEGVCTAHRVLAALSTLHCTEHSVCSRPKGQHAPAQVVSSGVNGTKPLLCILCSNVQIECCNPSEGLSCAPGMKLEPCSWCATLESLVTAWDSTAGATWCFPPLKCLKEEHHTEHVTLY
jgi:hypothetical protein